MDYYTQFIESDPEWKLVEIYTDEGFSGLSSKNREGFNRMITDALKGRHAWVERLTVYNDNRLVYSLKDGSEITIML